MQKVWFIVIAAASGAASGAAVLLIGLWSSNAHSRSAPQATAATHAEVAPAAPARFEPIQATIRAPVAAVQPAPQASAAPLPEGWDSAPPDPAAEKAEVAEIQQKFKSAFEAEGRDQNWASSAESSLGGTLSKLAEKNGFRFEGLACKTTVCSGKVTVPNHGATKKTINAIIHESYQPNCAIGVTVPDGQGDQALTGDVRFECEQARADSFSR